MRKAHILTLALFLIAGCALKADQLLTVTLNTGSLYHTSGSLDFAFDAGALSSQAATVQVLNFTGAVISEMSLVYTGAVTGGPLPAPITISNSTAHQSNDLLEGFFFTAPLLSFTLDFSGPAVNSPGPGNTSTSQFAFYTYSDAKGTVPALTNDPSGLSGLVTVNLNGSLSASAISPNLTFAASVPEPAPLWLLGGAFALFGAVRFLRR